MADELTTNCGSILISNCGSLLLSCASVAIGGSGAGGRRIRVKARSDPNWSWGVYRYPDWAKPNKRRE